MAGSRWSEERLQARAGELQERFWPAAAQPWLRPPAAVVWVVGLIATAGRHVTEPDSHEPGVIEVSLPILARRDEADLDAVLLHELIHHWQHQHPRPEVRQGPTHGREFRAEMHRINALLGREAVTIYHTFQVPVGRGIEDKLRKILALASSPNEHEAALAAARAQELMSRYQIALDQFGEASELPPVEEWRVAFSRRGDRWRDELWNAVAEVNACVMFWQTDRGLGCRWYLIGRPTAIEQAQLLGEYLLAVVEREVNAERKRHRCELGRGPGLSYLTSFRLGIVERVADRLRADRRRREEGGIAARDDQPAVTALVVRSHFEREQRATAEYVRRAGYRFGRSTMQGPRHAGAYGAGREVGDRVSLARQVPGGGRRKLLGG